MPGSLFWHVIPGGDSIPSADNIPLLSAFYADGSQIANPFYLVGIISVSVVILLLLPLALFRTGMPKPVKEPKKDHYLVMPKPHIKAYAPHSPDIEESAKSLLDETFPDEKYSIYDDDIAEPLKYHEPPKRPEPSEHSVPRTLIDPNFVDEDATVASTEIHSRSYPCLVEIVNGCTLETYIDKNRFLIGRIKNECGFICSDPMVGRRHAEILEIGGTYYIKEVSAQNHTYLSGGTYGKREIQLDPNEKYPLSSGTKIRLAKETVLEFRS
jgi:hypothetical protein